MLPLGGNNVRFQFWTRCGTTLICPVNQPNVSVVVSLYCSAYQRKNLENRYRVFKNFARRNIWVLSTGEVSLIICPFHAVLRARRGQLRQVF